MGVLVHFPEMEDTDELLANIAHVGDFLASWR